MPDCLSPALFCSSCSHARSQIPSLGQLNAQCLGVIGHIPLWAALLTVAFRYGLGPAWSAYRPIWLRRFAAEKYELPSGVPDQESGGTGKSFRGSWTAWNVALLCLNLAAAFLCVGGALARPDHAHLSLIPVVPSVRVYPSQSHSSPRGGCANPGCTDHIGHRARSRAAQNDPGGCLHH